MFLISMSLVIFCLLFSFVDYVPVKGEIIWFNFRQNALSYQNLFSLGCQKHVFYFLRIFVIYFMFIKSLSLYLLSVFYGGFFLGP